MADLNLVTACVGCNAGKGARVFPAPSRRKAVWLACEHADEQLEKLGGNPGTYIPSGVNANEFPLMKGRPVITVEQCPTLGTTGDLILADLNHYVIVRWWHEVRHVAARPLR
jgi:HK97 family phage major capsid protein